MEHWTKRVKAERDAYKKALDDAILALRLIPQSRMDKERRCPDSDPAAGLAYTTCAQEVDRLGQAVAEQINDSLAKKGVL